MRKFSVNCALNLVYNLSYGWVILLVELTLSSYPLEDPSNFLIHSHDLFSFPEIIANVSYYC